MQRITITIDDDLLGTVDALMERQGYESRSEALRDIIRSHAARERLSSPETQCIGTLSLVFDYGVRDLAQRIAHAHHAHHEMVELSARVYLDHDSCMEISVLRGAVADVRRLAESLSTQRGVRHANLHLLPVRVETSGHGHLPDLLPHQHLHT